MRSMRFGLFVLSFVHVVAESPVPIGCAATGRDMSYIDGLAIVHCPANCAEQANQAFGSSIHPAQSVICASAIGDGVLPTIGGSVVVSLAPAIEAYVGKKTGVVATTRLDGKTEASFHLYGLSTLDQIVGGLRVIDARGEFAAAGLLQVRTDRGFGTVCGMNPLAADVACRALGYDHGTVSSSPCSTYGGTSLCGAVGSPVAMRSVLCTGGELDLEDCVWSAPNEVCLEHTNDAVISCAYAEGTAEPSDGTLRLLSVPESPSVDGTGRLDVFKDGRWGPVCSSGFTSASASVACQQLGYSGITGTGWDACRNLLDGKYCGYVLPQISDVQCDGHEMDILSCARRDGFDVFCGEEDGVVLSCEGAGGDARGQPSKVAPPNVAVAAFAPRLRLSCESTLSSLDMTTSMPGASFVGTCGSCIGTNGALQGTLIYTTHSSICKAAVHAGVVGADGGDLVVTIGFGQESYFGRTNNGVRSEDSGPQARSFVVAKQVPEIQSRIAIAHATVHAGRSSFGFRSS